MKRTKEQIREYSRQYYLRNDGKNRKRIGTFSRKKDLLGKRYGRLKVAAAAKSKKSGNSMTARWLCMCDCGKEIEVRQDALSRGDTVSCGCFTKDRVTKPKGVASFNLFLFNYQRSAKKRNIEWGLSDKEVKGIISRNCEYCGAEPKEYYRSIQKKNKTNGNIFANGIDRVDNSKGYAIENCVPCCSYCNSIKNNKTKEEFLDHIKNIYEFSVRGKL